MAYKIGKAARYKDPLLALKGFLTNAKKAYNCQPGSNTGDGYVSAERASTSPVDETWTLTATTTGGDMVSGGAGYVRQSASGDSGRSAFSLTAQQESRTATIALAPATQDGEEQIYP